MKNKLMKKNFRILTKFLSIIYKILPFFGGMYCYYPAFKGQNERIYPLLDAVYASLKLSGGSTEGGVVVG